MIMRTAMITTAAVYFFATSCVAIEPAETVEETSVRRRREESDTEIITPENVTAVAVRFVRDYVTDAICSYSPDFCDKHQLQSRGIQSYLATAGTMFAGVLGIILMKIKILVVLSLITTIIGKMLLFYAFIKAYDPHSHHHVHKSHAPFVKYTRDKYYIKHAPSEHNHDVIIEPDHHHTPYRGHQPLGGVSYYKR